MKKNFITYTLIVFYCLISAGIAEEEVSVIRKTISSSGESELVVHISFGVGILHIRPIASDKIFSGVLSFKETEPSVEYSIYKDKGYLDLDFGGDKKEDKRKTINISSLDEIKKNSWELEFSTEIPISFKIEMGASENYFEFGGMQLKELVIEAGASDTEINFASPNPINLDILDIEGGVSKISGRNMLNANFREFNFEGGVGDYTFEFLGDLLFDARLDIEMEASKTKLIMHPELAFQAEVKSSLFCSVKIDKAERDDDTYTSYNFAESPHQFIIRADAGVGAFRILVPE